jgi:hypothetical protein
MKIKSAIIVVTMFLVVFGSVALLGGVLQKAQNAGVSATDAGFVPSTGQINLGYNPKVPSSSFAREIPSAADARAAFFASKRMTYAFDHDETQRCGIISGARDHADWRQPRDYPGEVL